jgi:hypothetical protein
LNESLKLVFDAFHARSIYLNSVKDTVVRPASAMQGPPAIGKYLVYCLIVILDILRGGGVPLTSLRGGKSINQLKEGGAH